MFIKHAPTSPTIRLLTERFEANDFDLEDRARPGRPVELDLSELQKNVEVDPYQSSREVARTIRVDQSTVVRGLKSIGKVKKLGRLVPHALKDFDKKRRVDMSMFFLSPHRTKALLDDLFPGDEKCIHYSNNVRKAQWGDKEEQPSAVAKPELHVKKVMLSIWWSVRGVEYWELLDEGKTITSDVYSSKSQKSDKQLPRIVEKKQEFSQSNTRPHISKVTNAKELTYRKGVDLIFR